MGEAGHEALRSSRPFVVMAKPVGPMCNLDCAYCYYLGTEALYARPHRFRMPDDVLEAFVRGYIAASPGPVVQFVWHGGEPALAGIDFYRRAVELQRRFLPEGWTCWNNLQTNGTLLDDEWCAFLAEERFDVGLSIDGTRWLHDSVRRDRNGHGSFVAAVAAVRRLQARGIQPDLLCTVTSAIAKEPAAVYRGLRDLGTGWLQFIPIVRRGQHGVVTPDSVSPEAYGRFLCEVFDQWVRNDLGKQNVQLFAEMSLVWSGGAANVCWMAPECGRVLVVEHDGAVYACDHFVAREYRRGSIAESHLGVLVDAPEQRAFGVAKRDGLPARCRSCRWLDVCNGGCPKDRFVRDDDGDPGLSYLCGGLRMFFEYAEQPLRHAIRRLSAGDSAGTVMVQLRTEAMARWARIGRNDPCPCRSGRKAKQCCWWQRP